MSSGNSTSMPMKRCDKDYDCCLHCKSYSGRGSSLGSPGWCLRRRLSVHGGFLCSDFRRSSELRYAMEAREVDVMPCGSWE